MATEAGFNYSAPLKAKGGTWTFDALNNWLTNPRADVPGTLMTFAGISNENQRADVIAYLNSNSDKPLPLPKAAQAKPAGGAPASPGYCDRRHRRRGPRTAARCPAPTPPAPAAPANSARRSWRAIDPLARGCEVHFVAANGRHAGAAIEKHIRSGLDQAPRRGERAGAIDCTWSAA